MENTKHLILKDFEGRQIMKSYQNDEIFKAKKGLIRNISIFELKMEDTSMTKLR